MRNGDLEELELIFPKLADCEWQLRSDAEKQYNCLAWAFGSTESWWESIRYHGYYWPARIPREDSVDNWVKIAELHGFELCADGEFDAGSEKLAIFVNQFGEPGHIARSAEDSGW